MRSECCDCAQPLNPNQHGIYREITGWERVRPGGGANAVMIRAETGRLRCAPCGERARTAKRLKVGDNQGSLL